MPNELALIAFAIQRAREVMAPCRDQLVAAHPEMHQQNLRTTFVVTPSGAVTEVTIWNRDNRWEPYGACIEPNLAGLVIPDWTAQANAVFEYNLP